MKEEEKKRAKITSGDLIKKEKNNTVLCIKIIILKGQYDTGQKLLPGEGERNKKFEENKIEKLENRKKIKKLR